MPSVDKNDQEALSGDKEKESRDKSSKSKGASKTKDLSHVPCKFFKVGSCTAGASCPFSHSVLEPGQAKDVCAWFVKGNCKFGHKCALAHILPGQSMSMDRKNKKAAQAANAATGGKDSGRGKGKGQGERGGRSASNALLSGSTAPTRILQGGSTRAPMPMALKATISPSAPAPPLQDSDFAALSMPDDETKLPNAPAVRKSSTAEPSEDPASASKSDQTAENMTDTHTSSPRSPLPSSTPSQPVRINDSTKSAELGPIGSPRSASSQDLPTRVNGFSPATSPSRATSFLPTSPFSAPGTQSVFYSEQPELPARSGIAASLGAPRTWAEYSQLPAGGARDGAGDAVVVEEEDLEEFIPGSLSDLLTPEERSRRYSRTVAPNSAGLTPGMASPTRDGGWGVGARPTTESHHHRYSRSVPAPTLLGDIKSIWSDSVQAQQPIGSPRSTTIERTVTTSQMPGFGTPSSFKSTSAFGGRSYVEDQVTAFLSPSNASAAFLPGTHYLGAKTMQRANSGGLRTGTYAAGPGANAANLLARLNEPVAPQTASHTRTHFDGTSESYAGHPFQLGGRPNELEDRHGMSPSALALQAHAPGQSLPQGLAAGYSRIHALPPPPVIPSPSASSTFAASQPGTFAPGTSFQGPPAGPGFNDWFGMSPGKGGLTDQVRAGLAFDIAPAPGRMSYSSAAAIGGRPGAAPPPAARTPSGKSWAAPTSPLSLPVIGGGDDDDELFHLE